jgi:hypothetical protein
MIVQSAPSGLPRFVIEQVDHARTCGQLARAFGNSEFKSPVPRDLVIYVVEHHDEGWAAIDSRCEQSPDTGLPYHLTETPLPYLIQTSQGSPDFNEAYHPFCGLLSSMHTYGLYNGRYGLSDFIFIDKIPPEYKPAADAMLIRELERQNRLKEILRSDPVSMPWVEDQALLDNYKLLQFFDTLALYFQTTHPESRTKGRFLNVPDGKRRDHTISISPRSDGTYVLTPWVFATATLEIFVEGRYIAPQPPGTNLKVLFESTPKQKQFYRLTQG